MLNLSEATHLQFLRDDLALVENSGQRRESVVAYLKWRIAFLEQIIKDPPR